MLRGAGPIVSHLVKCGDDPRRVGMINHFAGTIARAATTAKRLKGTNFINYCNLCMYTQSEPALIHNH